MAPLRQGYGRASKKMNEYNPQKIEKKWQESWEKQKLFSASTGSGQAASDTSKKPFDSAPLDTTRDKQDKPKYYALFEFPYPSGDGLHVGHLRPYIGMDIIARKRRMEGYNVLYPIGWDAFGLPTENYAIKTGIHPSIATKQNTDNFRRQMKLLGLSLDWNREINTTDPAYYKWTQWMFLQFFKHGLAYKANVPINWCKSCKIGLANEEVVNNRCERCGGEVEKKNKDQWMIRITKYADRLLEGLKKVDYIERAKIQQENWIGRSTGAEIAFPIQHSRIDAESDADLRGKNKIQRESASSPRNSTVVNIFTTRPDTLFGATYLVISPEHPFVASILGTSDVQNINAKAGDIRCPNIEEIRTYVEAVKQKTETERTAETKDKTGMELKGIKAINPATKEEIPIFVADYVLADYGTGAIMAVPAHDERDFEFAKKYQLPIKEVISPLIEVSSGEFAFRPRIKTVPRECILAIVKHWERDEYLVLKSRKHNWKTFVVGGIEKNEDKIKTALREIEEETGFTDLKLKSTLGTVHALHFAPHKNENRFAKLNGMYFILKSGARKKVSDEEKSHQEVQWIKKNDIAKTLYPKITDWVFWQRLIEQKAYSGEGIVINSGKFSEIKSEEAKKKITEFVGGKTQTQYKLRDWVFSRQRYWGEPIPLVFCEHCKKQAETKSYKLKAKSSQGEALNPGWFAIDEKNLPLELPEIENYKPTDTGESPLAAMKDWTNTKCPKCGGPAKRETDVMPNWAGSSWYFLRYTDPHNDKEFASMEKLKYWMGVDPVRGHARALARGPEDLGRATSNGVDWYNGGMEHTVLHLLYSRFWNMFLYDIGVVPVEEPYKKRTSHGFILGEGGIKMSKSKGNVINPDELVREFGADSLRLYEMFIGPFDQTVAWDPRGILGPERFLKRVWEIHNRSIANNQKSAKKSSLNNSRLRRASDGQARESANNNAEVKKLEGALHRTIKKVSEDIESLSMNTAVSALMIFANECYAAENVPVEIWKKFLVILTPFAPHIAEELYEQLKIYNLQLTTARSIHEEPWPEYNPKLIEEETFELVIQVNGKVRGKVSAQKGVSETESRQIAEATIAKWLDGKSLKKVIFVKNRLINFIVD